MPSELSKNLLKTTDLEKRIYNSFLIQYRKSKGQAFRPRKDFEGFEKTEHYPIIKRIANFFLRYPDVDMDTYFMAPYKIYPDTAYFDLKYFSSPRGIKAYTIYKMMLDKDSPDQRVERVKDSISFVTKFCMEEKIPVVEYATYHKSGTFPEWVYHVKKNLIDPFFMMAFSDILHIIENMPEEEREFLLGDFGMNYMDQKHKYNISTRLKPMLSSILPKIQNILSNS